MNILFVLNEVWCLYIVENKTRVNLETGVTRKESAPNFPKNKHFLPPDVRIRL